MSLEWLKSNPPALVPDPPASRSLEGWGEAFDPKGDINEPVVLRLERQGDELFASFSPDSKRWTPLPVMKLDFAADLRVGVAAVNTATKGFTAEFEGLAITP